MAKWKKYTAKQKAAWAAKQKKGVGKSKKKWKTPYKKTKKAAKRVRDDVAYGKRMDGQRIAGAARVAMALLARKNL